MHLDEAFRALFTLKHPGVTNAARALWDKWEASAAPAAAEAAAAEAPAAEEPPVEGEAPAPVEVFAVLDFLCSAFNM